MLFVAEGGLVAEVQRRTGAVMSNLRREDNERCRHSKAAQHQRWADCSPGD